MILFWIHWIQMRVIKIKVTCLLFFWGFYKTLNTYMVCNTVLFYTACVTQNFQASGNPLNGKTIVYLTHTFLVLIISFQWDTSSNKQLLGNWISFTQNCTLNVLSQNCIDFSCSRKYVCLKISEDQPRFLQKEVFHPFLPQARSFINFLNSYRNNVSQ